MTSHRLHRLDAEAGFTLLEALVAMALMGMIVMALATITGQWLPHWKHGFSRLQGGEQVAISIDRLASDLSAAEFVSANGHTRLPLFKGRAQSVIFVRTAFGPNARPGLDLVRIAELDSEEGLILVRTQAPFFPSMWRDHRPPKFGDPVVLLRPPYRLSFSYAGTDGIWRNDWHREPRLPEAVRFAVYDSASQMTPAVTSATLIHAQLPIYCLAAKSADDCLRLESQQADTASSGDARKE